MNPQAKILNVHGLLNAMQNAIIAVLNTNRGITMSSNELLIALPSALQLQLATISGGYSPRYACGNAASYVGTVAAMIAKTNPAINHNRHHYCPILRRFDDAFTL